MRTDFWNGKRVFLTGHTGFKGSWMSMWLSHIGANVHGFSLPPSTTPAMFTEAGVEKHTVSTFGDIRDRDLLVAEMTKANPEIAIHFAAQPLVREGYTNPHLTYETNVMGTVNFLEAVRKQPHVRAVLIITTDKVYENNEWCWGYRETDALGGHDPYSSSKAASEIAVASYRASFFAPADYDTHGIAIATARAGNVIGGGDWANDRLIPDLVRAFSNDEKAPIRFPNAVRPWEHVLEPLSGYLMLCEALYTKGISYGEAWNFGPNPDDAWPVSKICDTASRMWGDDAGWQLDGSNSNPHEAGYLYLDVAKVKMQLGYKPRWNLEMALDATLDWYRRYLNGENAGDLSFEQIKKFISTT